jgi:hypothetical protein
VRRALVVAIALVALASCDVDRSPAETPEPMVFRSAGNAFALEIR